MRSYYGILLSLLQAGIFGCTKHADKTEGEVISFPVHFVQGFGPFAADFASAAADSPDTSGASGWSKTYKQISGIPKTWKNVVRSMVWINGYQLVYQNFMQGNIDSSFYQSLQKSWAWTPDGTRLSKDPIRCYVYVVRGTDESGKLNVVIDTNNNLDMSDESPFYPENATPQDTLRYYQKTYQIEYDIFQNGGIKAAHLPMAIRYLPHLPSQYRLAYSFPQYAVAEIDLDDHKKALAINPGFTSPSGYEESELAIINKNENYNAGFYNEKGIGKGEFVDLEIGGQKKRFQNLGYDEFSGLLHLKAGKFSDTRYSTQVGYKFKPFFAEAFNSGKKLSLQDYRGKYLLIDFWGTWCKPCVEDIPDLIGLYENVDTSRIAFLGIVGHDKPHRLTGFLSETPLPWPQILSDSANKLIESYNIQAFPSTFLIAPDGTIVDTGLRRNRLRDRLKELKCLK